MFLFDNITDMSVATISVGKKVANNTKKNTSRSTSIVSREANILPPKTMSKSSVEHSGTYSPQSFTFWDNADDDIYDDL